MQLFTFARKGDLGLDNMVLCGGSIGVAGRFSMSRGGVRGEYLEKGSDLCGITGHPRSVITLNSVGFYDLNKCGISLNRSRLKAFNMLPSTHPNVSDSVGVRAVDSVVKLASSYVGFSAVGNDLV